MLCCVCPRLAYTFTSGCVLYHKGGLHTLISPKKYAWVLSKVVGQIQQQLESCICRRMAKNSSVTCPRTGVPIKFSGPLCKHMWWWCWWFCMKTPTLHAVACQPTEPQPQPRQLRDHLDSTHSHPAVTFCMRHCSLDSFSCLGPFSVHLGDGRVWKSQKISSLWTKWTSPSGTNSYVKFRHFKSLSTTLLSLRQHLGKKQNDNSEKQNNGVFFSVGRTAVFAAFQLHRLVFLSL